MKIIATRYHGDLQNGFVTTVLHIRNQRCRAGEIDLDPGRRRRPLYDIPDRRHGFLPQGGALVAGQIQLHICGLAIGALRARRRESISP